MSYALITGETGDGRYTVELDFGEAARNATVANLDAYIVKLQNTRSSNQVIIDDRESEIAAQVIRTEAERDDYIAMTKVNADADPAAFNFERRKLILMRGDLGRLQSRQDMLDGEIETRQRQRTALAQLITTETKGAWCTTYTVGATGYVATVDIPGDDRLVLIAPNARPWTAADGILLERALCDPNQAFFNAAIQAGWQSQEPTYRWGVITGINYAANTADVELAAATMTGQRLDINERTTLTAIPVEYQSCGASVFEIDDNVVVQFVGRSWDEPRVIGFVSDPRPCSIWYAAYYQLPARVQFTLGDLETGDKDWPANVVSIAEQCMATDLVVRARFNRGAWVALTHNNTIDSGGYTPKLNQWWDPAYAYQDGPTIEFQREPNFGGTDVEPDYAVGVDVTPGYSGAGPVTSPYGDAATIEALVQTSSGVIVFNAAFTYDVTDGAFVSEVLVAGGIRASPVGIGDTMTALTGYELLSTTGD